MEAIASPALVFEGVQFAYRKDAPLLHDVTFTIEPGQAAGLFGPNGAGKTTITRLAMALLQPTGGAIITAGHSTRQYGPDQLARRVGYLFQNPGTQLFARTVAEEIGFGLRQMGWDPAGAALRVEETLDSVGLEGLAGEHPYDLPEPLRRMVAFATALVAAPQLLILDEPSAGLDRRLRDRVSRILREHLQNGGSILAVTHDPAFATEVLDRALLLSDGQVSPLPDLASLWRHPGQDSIPHPLAGIVRGLGVEAEDWRIDTVAREISLLVHGTC